MFATKREMRIQATQLAYLVSKLEVATRCSLVDCTLSVLTQDRVAHELGEVVWQDHPERRSTVSGICRFGA